MNYFWLSYDITTWRRNITDINVMETYKVEMGIMHFTPNYFIDCENSYIDVP